MAQKFKYNLATFNASELTAIGPLIADRSAGGWRIVAFQGPIPFMLPAGSHRPDGSVVGDGGEIAAGSGYILFEAPVGDGVEDVGPQEQPGLALPDKSLLLLPGARLA